MADLDNPKNKVKSVHHILVHSYGMYFALFLIGVALDIALKLKIFATSVMVPTGLGLLSLATLIIFWAQKTSRNLNKENITKETFCKGPYCYVRSPTHWGLFLLMLGFGVIANAIFVILTTLISFLVSRFVFLNQEEIILEKKYGEPYLEYKKQVKL